MSLRHQKKSSIHHHRNPSSGPEVPTSTHDFSPLLLGIINFNLCRFTSRTNLWRENKGVCMMMGEFHNERCFTKNVLRKTTGGDNVDPRIFHILTFISKTFDLLYNLNARSNIRIASTILLEEQEHETSQRVLHRRYHSAEDEDVKEVLSPIKQCKERRSMLHTMRYLFRNCKGNGCKMSSSSAHKKRKGQKNQDSNEHSQVSHLIVSSQKDDDPNTLPLQVVRVDTRMAYQNEKSEVCPIIWILQLSSVQKKLKEEWWTEKRPSREQLHPLSHSYTLTETMIRYVYGHLDEENTNSLDHFFEKMLNFLIDASHGENSFRNTYTYSPNRDAYDQEALSNLSNYQDGTPEQLRKLWIKFRKKQKNKLRGLSNTRNNVSLERASVVVCPEHVENEWVQATMGIFKYAREKDNV